jgi:hypothetical protein
MAESSQVLDNISNALSDGPFKVSRDIRLYDGQTADVTASRTYFSWKGLVIQSQHVIVRHIDNASRGDAMALFDAGFQFAKKVNTVPLLRGMQFGYMIIPVIIGKSPDPYLFEAVSQCPQKHWALFEYPIVVDLTTGRTSCFEGIAAWGAFFFSDMRQVADKYIKGSLPCKTDEATNE